VRETATPIAPRSHPKILVRLLHVVGARPNFPKLAPVHRAAATIDAQQVIVHTGQHYDDQLSGAFFRDLGIPAPDVNLLVGSETHALQTARIMERFEPLLLSHRPDWLLVYGDVNSTMAGALVAAKLGIRIAHVEAGLRSYDRTMPEEINRIVTDRLADLLLTPSRDADDTLRAEGEPEEEIAFVGNVMIDSLLYALPAARATRFRQKLGADGRAVVVTLHRPSNVDHPDRLRALVASLREIAMERPVIFPVHPRTRQRILDAGLDLGGVTALQPVTYLQMLDLIFGAHAVITDSGGLQEETTALGIPCLTVRENTERPITITEGTNLLAPDPLELPGLVRRLGRAHQARRPEGWDGHAGERIVHELSTRILRVHTAGYPAPSYAAAV
jgi:UDP-N-acetylglucosamine 2-epimerase (non-hydrolysing)